MTRWDDRSWLATNAWWIIAVVVTIGWVCWLYFGVNPDR